MVRLRTHLTNEAVIHSAYGLSETGVIATMLVGADTPVGEGSLPAGWPTPGTQVAIVGEDGSRLDAGQTGEVVVAGENVALGYWGDPELTKRTFAALPDGRRRMRTGDRGRLRDDGALELLGRLDHMVKTAGYRVELGDFPFPSVAEIDGRDRPTTPSGLVAIQHHGTRPPLFVVHDQYGNLLPICE